MCCSHVVGCNMTKYKALYLYVILKPLTKYKLVLPKQGEQNMEKTSYLWMQTCPLISKIRYKYLTYIVIPGNRVNVHSKRLSHV